MSVTCSWDPERNGYQVYWRCNRQLKIRIPCAHWGGDQDIAKRVAERLKAHIEETADRSNREAFLEVRDRFIAEASREPTLAAADPPDRDPETHSIAASSSAAGSASLPLTQALTMVQPQSIALPGLNVQWPWSRLILAGVKDEIRTYDLGDRNICRANQETWIVETPGDKVAAEDIAVLDGVNVGHRPEVAQIIGTVTFSRAEQYANIDEFRGDAARHRIRAGCRFDWDGTGKRYVWRVLHTRKILDPIEQPGRKSTTGFNRPRAFTVTFFRAAEPEPSRAKRIRCCPKSKSVLQAVAAQRQRLADEANASDAVVLERRALESGLASIDVAMSMRKFERITDDLKKLRAFKERRLQELRACDNEQVFDV